MDIEIGDWIELKRLAGRTFGTSLHFAIATVNADGTPHVTPIGSLLLTAPGEGYFFEAFADRLCANLDRGSPVTVLGVNSGSWHWLRALITGRFATPPAFRLSGIAGARRAATEAERSRWQKKVRLLRFFKGHDLLWGRLDTVRELHFHTLEPVRLGAMTSQLHGIAGPHRQKHSGHGSFDFQ